MSLRGDIANFGECVIDICARDVACASRIQTQLTLQLVKGAAVLFVGSVNTWP